LSSDRQAVASRSRKEEGVSDLASLDIDDRLWEHVFAASPLVLVGTREPDGGHDFAPKHKIVTPGAHFGFVCRPSHATWRNAVREEAFTVSWPGPRQIVLASAAASPRCEDGEKKTLRAMPTIPAEVVEGALVEGCRLYVECRLERVIDDLGEDGLLLGRVVAARADPAALREAPAADGRLVHDQPLIAYLHPSQFALIDHSTGFPFPKDFSRD
jgi:flavin reductase (DIM6/NTAB) family NADH-FMN oxidoreductase RutF